MLRQKMLTLACAIGVSVVAVSAVSHAIADDDTVAASAALPAQNASVGLPMTSYSSAPIPIGYQNAAGTMAYGRQWVHTYGTQDWERFYHYPYVFYPQNFWGSEYYRSSESLYYRYPPEMRIPVYNKQWHNYYPEAANWNRYMTHQHKGPPTGGRYHMGHHFILDTF
jgi:hypothetical protein